MRHFRGHKGSVRDLWYSSDNRLIVSASEDRTVKVWDRLRASVLMTFGPCEGPMLCVGGNREGTLLASAGYDSHVWLWDVASGRVKSRWGFFGGASFHALAFSPDASLVAVAGANTVQERSDEGVFLWQVASGTRLSPLGGHFASAVAFAPKGRLLASGSPDRMVRFREPLTGTDHGLLRHDSSVTCLAFSECGRMLAVGTYRQLVVWDLIRHQSCVLASSRRAVKSVAFSPDGRVLLAGGTEGVVRLYDTETGRETKAFNWGVGKIEALRVAPDGMTAAVAGKRSGFVEWDLD